MFLFKFYNYYNFKNIEKKTASPFFMYKYVHCTVHSFKNKMHNKL